MSSCGGMLQYMCLASYFGGGIVLHIAAPSLGDNTAVIVAIVGFVLAMGKLTVLDTIGDDDRE